MRTQDAASTLAGTVEVELALPAPPAAVYAALTDRKILGRWFGDLLEEFRPRGSTTLDFGDGDFFTIDEVELAPPNIVGYRWRFLGIMPPNAIRWTVSSARSGSRVTVTDVDPLRGRDDATMLRQGWEDFTSRLAGFLASGKSTRYDWRRTFDGGIEVPCALPDALALVTSSRVSARWMPIEGGLAPGAALVPGDGRQPAKLEIPDVELTSRGVRFLVTSRQWRRPTECTIEAQARGRDTLITVAHGGWEGIDRRDDVQRGQRQRFAAVWIAALQRCADWLPRGSGDEPRRSNPEEAVA